MTLPYSGRTSAYAHKHEPWQDGDMTDVRPAVSKQWILDAQWTDCPVEVENQVKDLWRLRELGNDNYIYKTTIVDLLELEKEEVKAEQFFWGEKPEEQVGWMPVPLKVDYIVQYLREKGVQDTDSVWIHWWW